MASLLVSYTRKSILSSSSSRCLYTFHNIIMIFKMQKINIFMSHPNLQRQQQPVFPNLSFHPRASVFPSHLCNVEGG